jgi:hypothetical protein
VDSITRLLDKEVLSISGEFVAALNPVGDSLKHF